MPIPSIDFEVLYEIWDTPEHAPTRMRVRHSDGHYRIDRDIVGGLARATIFYPDGDHDKSATIIVEADTRRAAFHVVDLTDNPFFEALREKEGIRAGEAHMLGERYVLWRSASDGMAVKVDVRLTDDGIPLYVARTRTPTIPIIRALHLKRCHQDPLLLALPSDIVPQEVPTLVAFGQAVERCGLVRLAIGRPNRE